MVLGSDSGETSPRPGTPDGSGSVGKEKGETGVEVGLWSGKSPVVGWG